METYMSKLSKDQKRKKKVVKAKKALATSTSEAGRTLNVNRRVLSAVVDLSQHTHVEQLNSIDDILDYQDLTKNEYDVIFEQYLQTRDKELFLSDTADKHDLSFNPEWFLEMVIKHFIDNNHLSQELKDIANSDSLKLYEIADEIEKAGYKEYSALIRPVIKECGCDTGVR